MTALVVALSVLVGLLALLVAGLLRSHAEILRRLDALGGGAAGRAPDGRAARDTLTDPRLPAREHAPERGEGEEAPDVVGTTLDGEAVQVGMGAGPALLAFLSSGCSICGELWEELARSRPELPDGARLVVVTKDASYESPSRLRSLAPPGVRVVMSSRSWDLYRVPASPYFVHVGAGGLVEGEGVASSWAGVVSLLGDAVEDARGGRARQLRAEEALSAAGIAAGDPSLYGRES